MNERQNVAFDLKSANSNKQKKSIFCLVDESHSGFLKTLYIAENALSVAPFETSWHLKISFFTRPG